MGASSPSSKTRLHGRLLRFGAGGFRVMIQMAVLLGLSIPGLSADDAASLGLAAESGDLDAVERLISTGAEVNVTDHLGRSPLWLASSKGHARVVSRLVAAGARIDVEDRYGVSPLVVAVRRGHSDAVKELLKAGVSVNPTAGAKFIPLHVAVEQGDVDLVFLLLAAGADPLLQHESGDPGTDLVRNAMIRTRLRGLARNAFLFLDAGGPAVLTFPVERPQEGARFTVSGRDSVIVFASTISGGLSVPAVEIEWDGRGSDGGRLDSGDYVFSLYLPDGSTQSTRRRVVTYRQLSLHDAAAYGRAKVVTALIGDGADVNARDVLGRTALMYAAAFGNTDTADALLSGGADLDLVDEDARSAADYAARYAPGQPINTMLKQEAAAGLISR